MIICAWKKLIGVVKFSDLLQIGRPYVISKLKDYPKFQAVAIAIQRSGFKVKFSKLLCFIFSPEFFFFSSLGLIGPEFLS